MTRTVRPLRPRPTEFRGPGVRPLRPRPTLPHFRALFPWKRVKCAQCEVYDIRQGRKGAVVWQNPSESTLRDTMEEKSKERVVYQDFRSVLAPVMHTQAVRGTCV